MIPWDPSTWRRSSLNQPEPMLVTYVGSHCFQFPWRLEKPVPSLTELSIPRAHEMAKLEEDLKTRWSSCRTDCCPPDNKDSQPISDGVSQIKRPHTTSVLQVWSDNLTFGPEAHSKEILGKLAESNQVDCITKPPHGPNFRTSLEPCYEVLIHTDPGSEHNVLDNDDMCFPLWTIVYLRYGRGQKYIPNLYSQVLLHSNIRKSIHRWDFVILTILHNGAVSRIVLFPMAQFGILAL